METQEELWVIRLSILFNDEDPSKIVELNRVGANSKEDKKEGKNKKRAVDNLEDDEK